MRERDDLPEGLSRPARRALAEAGYARLEQFTEVGEDEVSGLHGMGPKALGRIREALASRGQSFAGGPSGSRDAKTERESARRICD